MSNTANLRRLATLALRQRKAHLLRTLQVPPSLIHGSVAERYLKCGRPNCRCQQGDKHGPFYYLNRSRPKAQTQSLQLKKDTEVAQARLSVQAFQHLLQSLDQLSWINWELLRRGENLAEGAG